MSSNSSSFKRRVRARMAQTGANYTTAMRAIQAEIITGPAEPPSSPEASHPQPAQGAHYRRPPAGSTWSYTPPANDDEVRRILNAERNWARFVRALEKYDMHPYFEVQGRGAPWFYVEAGGDRCVQICDCYDVAPRTPRGAISLRDRERIPTFLVYVYGKSGYYVADGIAMDYHPDLDDTPETFARRVWALVDETRRTDGCVSFVSR